MVKKESKTDFETKSADKKLSKKDREAQQKAIKEIENFLNYTGEVQDDI